MTPADPLTDELFSSRRPIEHDIQMTHVDRLSTWKDLWHRGAVARSGLWLRAVAEFWLGSL
jgi:hypothetical protein